MGVWRRNEDESVDENRQARVSMSQEETWRYARDVRDGKGTDEEKREKGEKKEREGERGRAEDEMKSRCGDMKKAAADGKRLKPAIQTLSELGSGGSPGGSQYGHDTSHTENKLHDS